MLLSIAVESVDDAALLEFACSVRDQASNAAQYHRALAQAGMFDISIVPGIEDVTFVSSDEEDPRYEPEMHFSRVERPNGDIMVPDWPHP